MMGRRDCDIETRNSTEGNSDESVFADANEEAVYF